MVRVVCWLICSNELYHCIAHEMGHYLPAGAATNSCCAKCCCLTGMCTVCCWPGKDHLHAAISILLPCHLCNYASCSGGALFSSLSQSFECTFAWSLLQLIAPVASASACVMHFGSPVLGLSHAAQCKAARQCGFTAVYGNIKTSGVHVQTVWHFCIDLIYWYQQHFGFNQAGCDTCTTWVMDKLFRTMMHINTQLYFPWQIGSQIRFPKDALTTGQKLWKVKLPQGIPNNMLLHTHTSTYTSRDATYRKLCDKLRNKTSCGPWLIINTTDAIGHLSCKPTSTQ